MSPVHRTIISHRVGISGSNMATQDSSACRLPASSDSSPGPLSTEPMRFAFLVHPLGHETKTLLNLDPQGCLQREQGSELLSLCGHLHRMLGDGRRRLAEASIPTVRIADELPGLISRCGAVAEGRFYEIPLDAWEILDDPGRAVDYMEQAVDAAYAWGAMLI